MKRPAERLVAQVWIAVAILALAGSTAAPWTGAPLSGGMRSWIAVGAALAGVTALAGLLTRQRGWMAAAGWAGLACCIAWWVHLAVRDPRLWTLVREHEQLVQVLSVSRELLPGVLGRQPLLAESLPTARMVDRLWAAFYFMSSGWWLCLGGSLILIATLRRAWRSGWATLAVSIPAAAVLAWSAFYLGVAAWADVLRNQGTRFLAAADDARAIDRFDRAVRLDPQLARSPDLRTRRGLARHRLGESSEPEAQFAVARTRIQQREGDEALPLLVAAQRTKDPVLQDLVRAALADHHIETGLHDLRRGGFAAASGDWELALAAQPGDVRALYLVALSDFASARHASSLRAARVLLARSRNSRLNAQLQIIIGDNLWKQGDRNEARIAYAASASTNGFGNFRSMVSLGGF